MILSALVPILVLVLIVIVAIFIIDKTLPGDFNWIAKLIVGVVALLVLLGDLGVHV